MAPRTNKQPTPAEVLAEIKIIRGQNDSIGVEIGNQGKRLTSLELWQAAEKGKQEERREILDQMRQDKEGARSSSNPKESFDWSKLLPYAILVAAALIAIGQVIGK